MKEDTTTALIEALKENLSPYLRSAIRRYEGNNPVYLCVEVSCGAFDEMRMNAKVTIHQPAGNRYHFHFPLSVERKRDRFGVAYDDLMSICASLHPNLSARLQPILLRLRLEGDL